MREQRYKIAYISPDDLVSVFLRPPLSGPTKEDQIFRHQQIQLVGVPDDAEVHGVDYDPRRRQCMIHIYSNEFPIVPDGELIPLVHVIYRIVVADQNGNIVGTALKNDDPNAEFGGMCHQHGSNWRELPPLF